MNIERVWNLLPAVMLLLSCGDGQKQQSDSEEKPTEFEIVGKKEKQQPDSSEDEPVSVSSILSGKAGPSAKDGDVGDVMSNDYEDPFGGDVDYLNGSDTGYDY